MVDGGHDLDLPPDPHEVRLRLDLRLLYRLYRHLKDFEFRAFWHFC